MKEINSQSYLNFQKLFGDLDSSSLQEIFKKGRKIELQTGEHLFHQGEQEQAFYVVLSGRLRAIKEDQEGIHILGDIGEGEPVGEFALFTGEPRMASVLAIRKSIVIEFLQKDYLELVGQSPALASSMTKFVIERLRRNTFQQKSSAPPKNITFVKLDPLLDLSFESAGLQNYFANEKIKVEVFDDNLHLDSIDSDFFDSLEQHEGINILICSEKNPLWSHQCLVYADLVVILADSKANPSLYSIEKELDLYSQNILNKKIFLVLIQPTEISIPKGTSQWLDERLVDLHVHVRKNDEKDLQRLGRILSHRALGLVLGGGGAKGYAHIGVVKALKEKGIPIDFLGGTSAGAIYGISMSFADFDLNQIEAYTLKSVNDKLTSNDMTMPLISFLSGKKIKRFVKEIFGESQLEDIWVNSYCVSTNFSKAKAMVHQRGMIWKQLLASIAIPGVFPPVVIDEYLHVDGAVMDNLPIEPMYQYPVSKILAVSLSGLPERKVDYEEAPSGWTIFWSKMTRNKKFKIPGISSLIINSLTLNSLQRQEVTKTKVSHYFELNLKGIGFMDDKKWKKIIQNGYEQTIEYLNSLPDSERI